MGVEKKGEILCVLSAHIYQSQNQGPHLHRIYLESTAENQAAQRRNRKRRLAYQEETSVGNGAVQIYGFPTNVAALQFEWAWQHPVESLAVRSAAASFKSLSGIANKIKLAYIMLSLPAWNSLNLVVNFFSTKYINQTSGCPTLPKQMRTQICSMDELPCHNGSNIGANDDLSSDEDRDSTDILQESTQESIEAARKPSDSPSSRGFEENFQNHISEKDDTSHESGGGSKENWMGIKNLLCSREEDQSCSSHPNRAGSSFVSSFCNIVNHVEDEQIPVSVKSGTRNSLQQPLLLVKIDNSQSISLVYLAKSRS